MAVKQLVLVPIYWGEWWVPALGNSYNWAEVNGLLQTVVGGRYTDYLNQYGMGRGYVSRTYVYPVDPPNSGFTDGMRDFVFRTAINDGHVYAPSDYDLNIQQPFYCLIVKPGVEHLLDPSLMPDVNTGAYHYNFNRSYWDSGRWGGQVCWVKGDSTSMGTMQRLVHEMAEAYSGVGEISDQCQSTGLVSVDGLQVPQYWSVADNSCCPPADPIPLPPTPPSPSQLNVFAIVVKILFGITGDGGGLGHLGKLPIPVDPWGWLTKEQLDLVFRRATSATEQYFGSDEEARHMATKILHELHRLLGGDRLIK